MVEPYNSIYAGDLEAIKDWLAEGNDISQEGVEEGPLKVAVRTGFISMVRFILKAANWKKYQDALDRAREIAYYKKRRDIVELPLGAGADPDGTDWGYVCILSQAWRQNSSADA